MSYPWLKHSVFNRKSRATKTVAMLRAPGEHSVRARIIKEVWWRVEYAERKPKQSRKP